jgi:hypothetical protein
MMADRLPIRLIAWDFPTARWSRPVAPDSAVTLHALVATLVRRGIVSAVTAAQDVDALRAELRRHGTDRYVLDACGTPGSGMTMGENLGALAGALRLRPERLLLLSNDIAATREATIVTPGIQFGDDELLRENMLDDPRLQGDDPELVQLQRMHIMLTRTRTAPEGGADGLRVSLDPDVASHLEEAIAVVHDAPSVWSVTPRPKRWAGDSDSLRALLEDADLLAGLVRLRDRFGDYGAMGLFVMAGRRPVLFCVAAQSADTGLAAWLYAALGRPELPSNPEAQQALAAAPVPALALDDPFAADAPARFLPALRVRGGRAAETLAQVLRPMVGETLVEATPQRGGHVTVRLDHTAMLPLALSPGPEVQAGLDALCGEPVPLRTALFDPAPAGTVLALLPFADADVPVYQHTALNVGVPLTLPPLRGADVRQAPLDTLPKRLRTPVEAALARLSADCGTAGLQDPARTEAILCDAFARVPPGCTMYVALAPVPRGRKAERVEALNAAIAAAASGTSIRLVDPAGEHGLDGAAVWRALARRIMDECGREAPGQPPMAPEPEQEPELKPEQPASVPPSGGSEGSIAADPLFAPPPAAPPPAEPPRRSLLSRLLGR